VDGGAGIKSRRGEAAAHVHARRWQWSSWRMEEKETGREGGGRFVCCRLAALT